MNLSVEAITVFQIQFLNGMEFNYLKMKSIR
jgi:hypothetical protein